MCTVLVPPGVNPTAVNKIYHKILYSMNCPRMRTQDNGGEKLAISNPRKADKRP